MIIFITYTPDERRTADCIYHFVKAISHNSYVWFSPVTAEEHESSMLTIQRILEAPSDTPEQLLDVAKGLVGLT